MTRKEMKSLEDALVLILHGCLQIDEESRQGWASRNATQLAQRLQQLVQEPCADASKVSYYLERRRRPLCWCLLLLGGRVDVQLHAAAELFSYSMDPSEATFLQQFASELTQHQQQHHTNLQQQQQLRQLQQHHHRAPSPLKAFLLPSGQLHRDGMAVTQGLLPDDGAGRDWQGDPGGSGTMGVGLNSGGSGGSCGSPPPEVQQHYTERLAMLLACVARDPESTELISHLALRKNGAPLACLVGMLTTPSASQPQPTSAGSIVQPKVAHIPVITPRVTHAARALSYLVTSTEVCGQLLAVGAVPPFMACLAAGMTSLHPPLSPSQQQQEMQVPRYQLQQQQLALDAANCLAQLSSLEAAGREMLRVQGPGGIQAMIALLNGAAGASGVEPAVRALAALTAHPTLRPGLVAAGATEALMKLVEMSGGPLLAAWTPDPPASGGSTGSPGIRPTAAAAVMPPTMPYPTMELALLALVRCIRSYGGGGGISSASGSATTAASATAVSGAVSRAATSTAGPSGVNSAGGGGIELPAAVLQLLLDVAAMPVRPQQQPSHMVAMSTRLMGTAPFGTCRTDGDGSPHLHPQPCPSAMAVVEATEALADMAREASGAMRLLAFAGHLVLLQRLLAAMPATPVPPSCSAPPLEPVCRRQLEACLRGLARLAMAAPSHPDLRLARTHEVLLHVLLAMGLADRPGWWALQGLCALASDASCAADLVSSGILPPVVAALRGLAAVQSPCRGISANNTGLTPLPAPRACSFGGRGGGSGGAGGGCDGGSGGSVAAGTSERDIEVAHLLGLLLQNLAGHKALARVAVAEGAVPAICEWMAVCAGNEDVEGAVLCCAALCLLGDGDPGTLVDMVHSDGIDTLIELLHPRWATASLVPSTVAAAIAVACRWPASAQAVRMAAGIPALADTLRGPHGLACCRPVVSALGDLIINDPPALREIRTTNTVIALGTQLQLLPNNDPRAARIRLLLRQLGEDPDTAMRLANSEADNALATAAAAPHHHHHHLNNHQHQHQHQHQHHYSRAGVMHPNASGLRLQLEAAAAAADSGSGGGGSWRWRFARCSDSGPERPVPSLAAAAAAGAAATPGRVGRSGSVHRSFRASSPGAIVPEVSPVGVRWRLGEGPPSAYREDLDCVLAALRGESSYKSLRRASLKQLAKRMDASDFSDVEDDVEDYMAVLEVVTRDQSNGPSVSRVASLARRGSKGPTDPRVTFAPSQPSAEAATSSAGAETRLDRPSSGCANNCAVISGIASANSAASAELAPGLGPVAATTAITTTANSSDYINGTEMVRGSSRPVLVPDLEAGTNKVKDGQVTGSSHGAHDLCGHNDTAASPAATVIAVTAVGDPRSKAGVRADAAAAASEQLMQSFMPLERHDRDPGSPVRHRYSGCDSSSSHYPQSRRSIDQVPPSVDFWLDADNPDDVTDNRKPSSFGPQHQPRLAEFQAVMPFVGALQGPCWHQENVRPHRISPETDAHNQYQYPYQPPTPPQQEEQEQDMRPTAGRSRNPVAHTLAVVNPLRLFGAVRRGGANRKAVGRPFEPEPLPGGGGGGVGNGAPAGWDCYSAPPRAAGAGRRSLQVDGEELVYWSVEPDS